MRAERVAIRMHVWTQVLTRKDFGTSGGWREVQLMHHWTAGTHNKCITGLALITLAQIRGHRVVEAAGESELVERASWYLDHEGKEEKDRRQVYSLTATLDRGVYLGLLGVIAYPRDFSEGSKYSC